MKTKPKSGGAPTGARAEEEGGREIPTKCGSCHVENEEDAKFCKGCGESMATQPVEEEPPPSSESPESEPGEGGEEEEERAEGDEPPPSSKPHPAGHPAEPERMQAPRKMDANASLAAILGATSESHLAIKTAAIKLRQVLDTAAGVTGKTDSSEIVGALLAVPAKLARGKRAAASLESLRAKDERRERGARVVDGMALLSNDETALLPRLIKTGAVERTKIVEDILLDNGNRRLDSDGKPMVRVRTKYARMDLGILRGMVTDLEGDAPKKQRNPFEPDPKAAEAAASTAGRGTVDQRVEAAKKHPVVVRMFNRPGNNLSLDALATSFVRNNFDLQGSAA